MKDSSIIDIVCRQTNYDKETAIIKLKEHNNDYEKVIKEFMGIKPKQEETCAYVSQQRYKIIRHELDNACRNYREKKELQVQEIDSQRKEIINAQQLTNNKGFKH